MAREQIGAGDRWLIVAFDEVSVQLTRDKERSAGAGRTRVLTLLVVLSGACSAFGAERGRPFLTLHPAAPKGDGFYAPPEPIPGKPGDVIWATEIDPLENGRVFKVLYRSANLRGEAIAVSGWIAIPARARPKDGYRVVSFAHGTTGMADECAPTVSSTPTETVPLLEQFLKRGYLVAATDYEGLGTPGWHPYVIGTSEAHSVLDAARAAREFAAGGSDVILFGHSQGGHAVIFANELAQSYAPDLNVLGTIASGAGVSDAGDAQLEEMKNSAFKGFIVMTAVSYAAAFGADVSPLSRWLTPFGEKMSNLLDTLCVRGVVAAFAPLPGDALFVANAPLPLTSDRFDLEKHTRAGLRLGASPLLLVHGRHDNSILPATLRTWAATTCKLGRAIQVDWFDTGHRVPYEAPEVVGPVVFDWMEKRFRGLPAESNCDHVPTP